MTVATQVIAVGDALGIVIPDEMLTQLRVRVGDILCLTEIPEGLLVTPVDPEFAAQMDAARTIIRENRDVLRKLAE